MQRIPQARRREERRRDVNLIIIRSYMQEIEIEIEKTEGHRRRKIGQALFNALNCTDVRSALEEILNHLYDF